jgi:hypothetical protein
MAEVASGAEVAANEDQEIDELFGGVEGEGGEEAGADGKEDAELPEEGEQGMAAAGAASHEPAREEPEV